MDMRAVKAREEANRRRIRQACPSVPERSGIYVLVRAEDGIRYAYVGQSRRLLTRLAQHLAGYQHIDLSLKKHGLWSEQNPTGWRIRYRECAVSELDERERQMIRECAARGYQLRNKTLGGQGDGKRGLDNTRSPRTYRDGVRQGYLNAQRLVARLFDKHLDYRPKSDRPNKNQQKAEKRFREFLDGGGKRGEDGAGDRA